MRKRVYILGLLAIVSCYIFSLHDPLQVFLNFVIDGIVPGTDIQLSFLPSLGVVCILLLLIKKWLSDIRFEMMRQTALEMNAERVATELSTATEKERTKRRHVIAALNTLEQASF